MIISEASTLFPWTWATNRNQSSTRKAVLLLTLTSDYPTDRLKDQLNISTVGCALNSHLTCMSVRNSLYTSHTDFTLADFICLLSFVSYLVCFTLSLSLSPLKKKTLPKSESDLNWEAETLSHKQPFPSNFFHCCPDLHPSGSREIFGDCNVGRGRKHVAMKRSENGRCAEKECWGACVYPTSSAQWVRRKREPF